MDLRIDEEKNIAYIKLRGKVSSENILAAFDATVSSEKYKKGMGRLWDFTEIDLSTLDVSVIPKMAQYSLSFPPGINDVKVAFVATRTSAYGLIRMFQEYSDIYAKTQVMVFDNLDEAEKWMMDEGDR